MTLDKQIEWWERQQCQSEPGCQLESEMPGFLHQVKKMKRMLEAVRDSYLEVANYTYATAEGMKDGRTKMVLLTYAQTHEEDAAKLTKLLEND